ncbi:SRPBCC family protein [Georgenia sp. 10Sc9-8]|uniref:SRPBCC family protein n=1 Tax=Georgenia halotolerans TaxID=3028317 RepID=A0ABT5U254_9MICO|nr:SRPBCC family protein [Georgenia halotolerans]
MIPLPVEETFALVTDLRRHGEWIPLTRVQAPVALRESARVSALTAGVFRDRMVVQDIIEPRLLELEKVGPVLLGRVTIAVTPLADGGRSLVQWNYQVHAAGPLPRRVTAAVLTPALDVMAGLVLWRIARHAANLAPASTGSSQPPVAR